MNRHRLDGRGDAALLHAGHVLGDLRKRLVGFGEIGGPPVDRDQHLVDVALGNIEADMELYAPAADIVLDDGTIFNRQFTGFKGPIAG